MLHKSSAWPLALLYAALIVFASLYPFAGWRDQELVWWAVFTQPLPPQYWTGFDVGSNIAGYLPLGFLLGLGMVRSGWPRGAVLLALGVGSALSLGMEVLQLYLPRRVPSNLDWLLNSAGAALGGALAWLLHWAGGVQRWADFRQRWLDSGAADTLTLGAIAQHMGCNPSTLQSQFRQAFGKAIFDHLRESRLRRAAHAITAQGITMAQAAALAGYRSPANFSTAFRRLYGFSPKNLRAGH